MTEKQRYAHVLRWKHYGDAYIFVERAAHGYDKPIYLEISDDDKCYQRGNTIHIGTGHMTGNTIKELFDEFFYLLGHELQHFWSTTDKDWTAAHKICFNTAIQKLSIRVFGKTRRLSKESDYLAFFSDLAKRGLYINKPLLDYFTHYILNCVEDGRIETIRTQLHPGFGSYVKMYRGKDWLEIDLRDQECCKAPDDLEKMDELLIMLDQIYRLSTMGIYGQGFLEVYKGEKIHRKVEGLIPDIAQAVIGKTCKDCMDHGIVIFQKLLDLMLDVCTTEGAALDLEKALQELLEKLLNEAGNSKFSANPSTEEKGSGLPSEALFGHTDLEIEVDQETFDKMMENAEEADEETPGVRIKVKVKDGSEENEGSEREDTSSVDSGDVSPEEGGEASSSGFSEEDGQQDAESAGDASGKDDSGEGSEAGSKESGKGSSDQDSYSGIEESSLDVTSGVDRKGHNNIVDSSENAAFSPEKILKAVREAMEAAASKASDFEAAEADAKLDEQFREASKAYEPVAPMDIDLSSVDSAYEYDVEFNEETRVYSPTERLPLELENRGRSLDRTIERIIKNKQEPDQRFLTSGKLDTRRLASLATDDPLHIYMKKGQPNKTDVAGFLLMDNSGSMGEGPGSTRNACCNAFAVIEEGFKRHMPLKIAAFDANGNNSVTHEVIKEFDEVSMPNLSFNFRDLGRSGCGNKDGYSIRVATRQLLARPEKDKILIIASDGYPTDYWGGYDEGCADVKAAVQEARQAGIHTVGMYMFHEQNERDFAVFRDMYGPEIVFASLDEIEDDLTRILKRKF